MRWNPWFPAAAALLPAIAPGCSLAGSLAPAAPRVEYLVDPTAIDEPAPRLSWRLESSERGQRQTAYRILVASGEALLAEDRGDLWDSGRVESGLLGPIPYAGKPLESRQPCFWKVRVWDRDGEPSPWSRTARWSMGLLRPEDWRARAISRRDRAPIHKDPEKLFLPPAQQFRREFSASRPVRRAVIYATALGIYELHFNGRRLGDALFEPGWTDYRRRAYYNAHDVTSLVREGRNAIGAWVADGWYSGYLGFGLLTGIGVERIGRYTYGKTPAFMAQLEIEYADGSRESVITDASWKATGEGPIREADFLMGEFYDARREMSGWSEPGFDDSEWEHAILAAEGGPAPATFYEFRNPGPGEKLEVRGREVDLGYRRPPRLEAYPGVPVRPIEEIRPVAISSPAEGVFIFDLGQNFAGFARLKAKGPAGTQVRLRFGEMLHPDGRLMTENLRRARAWDHYVLRGDPEGETWTPRFTFHGFRYVEVTGYPGKPGLDAITGIVLHSDTPLASSFECSDPMVNRLFRNIVWTQRANFLELPTDCPQRDERFGWTGDAQAYVRAASYNADIGAFYTKWLRELMESQRPSGAFPGYAPYPFQHGWDFGTAWCDAGVICPWTIYQVYGDTRVIERCWEPMVRFLDWRRQTSRDLLGVNHGNDWGDWLALGEKTPLDFIDTIYFAYSARLMAEMAGGAGKVEEAGRYRELFEGIRSAFRGKYLKPGGELAVDTQTAYALTLFAGLVPEDQRARVGERLARKILDNGARMSTGFLGTRALLPALSAAGQNDLAVRLLQSRKFPSWGYEVEQGATTIWERWDSYTREEGFGRHNASMNSFSHYAFGAVCEWMFQRLAGMDTDGPGYHRIIISPSPPSPGSNPDQEPIHWVRARYDSMNGRIAVNWKLEKGRFELAVAIPPGTSATVHLPANSREGIVEGGRPIERAGGVKFLRLDGDRAVLQVDSGDYRFLSDWPRR